MSDTTHEAPERIWLQLGAGDEGTHTWADHQVGWDDEGEYEPEYVRADLVQAAVAAALTGAMNCCTEELYNTALLTSNPPQSSAAWHARNAILALITDDAQAALDRVVAAERERCARAIESKASFTAEEISEIPADYPVLKPSCRALHDIAAAIRKGGE